MRTFKLKFSEVKNFYKVKSDFNLFVRKVFGKMCEMLFYFTEAVKYTLYLAGTYGVLMVIIIIALIVMVVQSKKRRKPFQSVDDPNAVSKNY